MSTLKQRTDDPGDRGEEAIADYLQAHPDFFERHLSLLANLKLPHSTEGPAVSLVERQVAMLRQRNMKLERKLRDLVEVARGNDQLAAKIHTLAKLLLQARSRAAVVQVLEEQLRTSFNADQPVLVVFNSVPDASTGDKFLRVLDRESPTIGPFKTFLQSSTPRCGRVRDAQRDFLFGADSVEIGSVALVPLGPKSEVGFLAIGNRDADHFHPGKSIDFLARLGELVACALRTI
jgi:uncharacterized protein YigA (DUF484 family)